jgi:hypothetical protein
MTAYDCTHPKLTEDYEVMNTKECTQTDPEYVEVKKSSYYLYERLSLKSILTKECKVKRTRVMFHCGMFSHTAIIDIDMVPKPHVMSEPECLTMYQTMEFRHGTVIIRVERNQTTVGKATIAGMVTPNGDCEGGTYSKNGQLYQSVVVIDQYTITMLERETLFDLATGKMIAHPICKLKKGTCYTGESRFVYQAPKETCTLRFLKRISVTELEGRNVENTVQTNMSVRTISYPLKYVRSPTVIVDRQHGIALLRKQQIVECNAMIYLTNYEPIVISKTQLSEVDHGRPVNDAKLYLYFNNKIDYLVWTYQQNTKAYIML